MKRMLCFITLLLMCLPVVKGHAIEKDIAIDPIHVNDSLRLAELDHYWKVLSKTVSDGDAEGYEAAYHEDAVVVFATGDNKVSISIEKAMVNWRPGFEETKMGKNKANVVFRLSQRIGDENIEMIFFVLS